jgi:hypothetical protein
MMTMVQIKCELAKWALPWTATIFTQLPYHQTLSLLLDRLLVLSEERNDYGNS